MELELEGNLVLERPPTRRWIAIIAVVVPVVACVCSVAWFIRAFIAPPMANVSSPMQLAAVAPTAQRAPLRAEAPVAIPEPEPQPVAVNEAAQPPSPPVAAAPAETPASLPMFATLLAAPPSFDAPAAFANQAQDSASRGSEPQAPAVGEQTAMLEPSTPIAGRIPIPHPKPHFSTALVTGPVPLPRPRPTDSAPSETPDLPAFDRHSVE